MKLPSRKVHISWVLGAIQSRQLPCELGDMIWLDAGLAARLVEGLQAFVAETFDHSSLCRVTPQTSTFLRAKVLEEAQPV
ncbi:hypothetical protein NRY68_08065 [Acidithiobacillus ferrooxidans]|nr:hypothetical protein [Acidithiobacillus ferrooxidans]MCR1354707.1 hypothetical protein [Acidithiobacillus ferrooxidans]